MVYASLMFSELVPGFKPNWLREYRSETHRLKREAGSPVEEASTEGTELSWQAYFSSASVRLSQERTNWSNNQ